VYRPPDIDHWCGNLLCSAADLFAGGLMDADYVIKSLIKTLDSWEGHDGPKDHLDADDILLAALASLGGQDVVDAYLALRKRCGAAWYA
jgi:hypothetical protein